MADIQDMGRFVAEGYSFFTEKDAVLAESERRKVQYLEERLDYSRPENILRIYRKMIDERVFRTPVGHFFLKNLQTFLLEQAQIDPAEVEAIPMYVTFDGELRDQTSPARSRVKPAPPKKEEKTSSFLPFSVILNFVLAAAIIAMFAITLKSDQPNILNYERTITNRYAAWEQQLTEREQAVKAKERELNLGGAGGKASEK